MSTEPTPAASGPDDFDRQLREITSGAAGAARFRELSAAERARLAGRGRPRMPRTWRQRLAARNLSQPVSAPPRKRPGRASAGRRRLRVVGGQSYRPAGQPGRQRLLAVAKTAAILVGFVALLVVLHFLGFGPQ
ncbi:MAG TPA: hypothetical protein VF843_11635 [Streptosporangiaceae bacterium]